MPKTNRDVFENGRPVTHFHDPVLGASFAIVEIDEDGHLRYFQYETRAIDILVPRDFEALAVEVDSFKQQ